MIEILLSILKTLGTSILAILTIGLVFFIVKFLSIKALTHIFLTKNKRIVYVVFILLFFGTPIIFALVTGNELLSVSLIYTRELMLSVIIVITFWVIWAFIENPTGAKRAFLVALLHTLINIRRKVFFGEIQVLFEGNKALDFFTIEYPYLKEALSPNLLNGCLKTCQIGTKFQATSQELMLYDINKPTDQRYRPLEPFVSLDFAQAGLQNYDVTSEFQTINELLSI